MNTIKTLIKGILSLTPVTEKILSRGTGGTISAKYCYSVWLRHIVMAQKNGLNPYPKIIAELGPGDSIGIGLAALLSGCDKYFALDVIKYSNVDRNIKIFNELIELFKNRQPIPGDDEWPLVTPKLEQYEFPYDIFSNDRLDLLLTDSRISKIRESIKNSNHKSSMIEYHAPWTSKEVLQKESVDMIYSQAVLEHIDNIKETYNYMYLWLKKDGFMSHSIDFKCHGTANKWNGHWRYSDFIWNILRCNRKYFLNRMPRSIHIKIINDLNFKIVHEDMVISNSIFTISQLAEKFRSISDQDLITSGTFIQAVKKG